MRERSVGRKRRAGSAPCGSCCWLSPTLCAFPLRRTGAHLWVPISWRVVVGQRCHLDGSIALVELYRTIYWRHAVDGRRGGHRYRKSDLGKSVRNSQIRLTYAWNTPGPVAAGSWQGWPWDINSSKVLQTFVTKPSAWCSLPSPLRIFLLRQAG